MPLGVALVVMIVGTIFPQGLPACKRLGDMRQKRDFFFCEENVDRIQDWVVRHEPTAVSGFELHAEVLPYLAAHRSRGRVIPQAGYHPLSILSVPAFRQIKCGDPGNTPGMTLGKGPCVICFRPPVSLSVIHADVYLFDVISLDELEPLRMITVPMDVGVYSCHRSLLDDPLVAVKGALR